MTLVHWHPVSLNPAQAHHVRAMHQPILLPVTNSYGQEYPSSRMEQYASGYIAYNRSKHSVTSWYSYQTQMKIQTVQVKTWTVKVYILILAIMSQIKNSKITVQFDRSQIKSKQFKVKSNSPYSILISHLYHHNTSHVDITDCHCEYFMLYLLLIPLCF